MNDKTITLQICSVTDKDTGIITAFFADDYSTVTQGKDMDQVSDRLVKARNLVLHARKKYGFEYPRFQQKSVTAAGFESQELVLPLR